MHPGPRLETNLPRSEDTKGLSPRLGDSVNNRYPETLATASHAARWESLRVVGNSTSTTA